MVLKNCPKCMQQMEKLLFKKIYSILVRTESVWHLSHGPLISPVPPDADRCDGNSTLEICSQEGGAPSPPRSQSRAMVSPWEGQPQRLANTVPPQRSRTSVRSDCEAIYASGYC